MLYTSDYDWNSFINENQPLERDKTVARLCQCIVYKWKLYCPNDLSLGAPQSSVVISVVSVYNIKSPFVMSSLAEVCTVTFMTRFSKCYSRSLYLHQIYSYDRKLYISFSNAAML